MSLPGIEIDLLGQTANDFAEAAVVGARAFHHDPFFEFLAPRPLQRARGLGLLCRSYVSELGDSGYYWVPDRQEDGSSAWLPG